MANIGNLKQNSGWHGSDLSCGNVGIYDLRTHIDIVFTMQTSGIGQAVQTAATANSPFAMIKNFECGNAYIFFRNESSTATFNIPHFVQGNVANNSGLVTTIYPTEFVVEGKGTFHLTAGIRETGSNAAAWHENAPAYKTIDGSHKIWFDGSEYVLSSKVGDKSGALVNGSVLPNMSFGESKSASSTVEMSNFTGNSVSANGVYVEVGYLNDQKLYRHAETGNYYYFFNGSIWVLSDTPFNTSGSACYINGTSSVTGTLNNSGGSNGRCFDGQSGFVRDGGMDPRSLATEDELSLMSTEDKLKVLITEENI